MAITGGKAGLALGKEWPGRVSGVCSADGVVAAGTLCGASCACCALGYAPGHHHSQPEHPVPTSTRFSRLAVGSPEGCLDPLPISARALVAKCQRF